MGTKSKNKPPSAKKPSRARKKIELEPWIRIEDMPKRADETKKWSPAMIKAAQMRANCQNWTKISQAVGLSYSAVSKYPSKFPNFDKLVDWFLEQNIVQYNRNFFQQMQRSQRGLDELETKIMVLKQELDSLRERFETTTDPLTLSEIRRGAFAASMALTEAVKAHSKITGFERYNYLLADYTAARMFGEGEGEGDGDGDIHVYAGIPGVDESDVTWYDEDE